MKTACVLSLASVATGQLLTSSRAELEQIVSAQEQVADVDTAAGFVNPTICDPSVKQTAGRIAAGDASGAPKYFFWLFESRSSPATDPLLMWLSGGPGCSSQLALLAENGPCTISEKTGEVVTNQYSWNSKANVMWVDQPAGVGFSTGLGTHDEAGVAKNMLYFLQGFYEQFPQYQSTDFYIFGESYAGHYVPAIAHKIWQSNKDGQGLHIPMAGIAIGNGLTNPQEQYKWYPEMGMTGGQSEGGHAPSGVINAAEGALMKSMVPGCILSIETCNKGFVDPTTGLVLNVTACMEAYDLCNLMSQIPYELTGKNPYDMRIPCGDSQLCYDFDRFTKWLNTASVQQELGVSKLWQSCNREVDLLFVSAGDWMLNYHTLIPDLLHDGLEVLIYAGDEDYICNWLGNRAWTQKLDWNSKDKFNAADENEWQLDGQVVAKHRAADHFHFMQVYEAGHMVPMDQPKVALEMVNAFVAGNLDSVVKSSQSVAV